MAKTEAEKQAHRDAIKGHDDDVRAAKNEDERRTAIAKRNAEKIRLLAAEGKISEEEVEGRLRSVEYKP